MSALEFIDDEVATAVREKRCVNPKVVNAGCGQSITDFDRYDHLDLQEYLISGLCKTCQDSIFI